MESQPGRSTRPLPRLARTAGGDDGRAASGASVRLAGLLLAHARAQTLVLLRSPAQLLFLLLAPAVALLAVVAPQDRLAEDPRQSAQAFAQMTVLGALAVSVFGLGINASEERASPWFSHLRTLPVSGWVITASRLLVTIAAVAGSMVPLVLVACTTTALPRALPEGTVPAALSLLAATGVAMAGCVPFLGLSLIIGYSFSPSTTVALTQVVVVPMAFAGGLLLPPATFPSWLEQISLFTPSRAVRDGVLATTGDIPESGWQLGVVWVVWSIITLAGAALAYARDEGNRFR